MNIRMGGVVAATVLGLAACGGGGGAGNGVTYDPNQVTQALANKVGVNGINAVLVTGTPPAPTAVSGLIASAPDQDTAAEVGTKVTVPVTVSSTANLESLFAKIPGASAFFQVTLAPAGGGKALMAGARRLDPPLMRPALFKISADAKSDTVLDFEVDVPASLEPGGELCFEFSVRDVNNAVSNTDANCIVIKASPTPTPMPTLQPEPTATPTPTTGPTPTPTPTPTPNSAADCLNPTLFAVGTDVQQVYRQTDATQTVDDDDSYTVTPQTTFNGQSAVVLDFVNDDDGLSYLRVEPANQRVLSFGEVFGSTSVTFDPQREFPFSLTQGQKSTQTYTTIISDGSTSTQVPTSVDTTYVGRERISVPAGSFDSCKFSETITATIDGSSSSNTSEFWAALGTGLFIKETNTGQGGSFVRELISASVNGEPVTGN